MKLVFEKTKTLLLYDRRRRLKYLGVILDDKGTFGAHIRYVTDKAEKSTAAVGKLSSNVGGPTGRTRKILLIALHLQLHFRL